ncbi:MAG: ATP-binding protein, partial [Anaerolineae bacterium]
AFEGAGASCGMRAVDGAVEEVWINPETLEPTFNTLGGVAPGGICGSGMISLLGELRATGIIDKSGRIVAQGRSPRVRQGSDGAEYVVAWAEPGRGPDVAITETDIQNLLRAKAAIYAGASVLCESVGLAITDVERVLIGGAFGRHIDVEKAVAIGLLPDLPWERFSYLGNTSVQGAYLALTCREHRRQADELAGKMTYLELSADNRFMDAFTSALFIPHTDESLFPSVAAAAAGPTADATGSGS